MNLDAKALLSFFKEIEVSRERQKGETEFQRDVFKRAKQQHFDVKAMRIVLQRRAMDASKRDEQDYNVHAYELALGGKKAAIEDMERGASAREAAAKHRLPRAAVTTLKPDTKNENFEPAESSGGVESRHAGASGDGDLGPCESVTCEASDRAGDNSRPTGASQPAAGVAPGPLEPNADGLDIPQFLRSQATA